MRAFTYVWYYFRSRDKDGGRTIRSAVFEKLMLHANLAAQSSREPELWAINVLHCGDRDCGLFLLL